MKRILLITFNLIFVSLFLFLSTFYVEAFEILPDPDICCNISIYAYCDSTDSSSSSSSSAKNLGHAFLTFDNITSTTYLIGDYTIKSHESISIGTWPSSITGYSGVCYNLETYYMNVEDHPSTVYLKQTISYDDLSKINEAIKSNNDWKLFDNCSTFAFTVWNSFSSFKINAGAINTPSNLINSIKKYDYYKGCQLSFNSNIGYYKDGIFNKIEKTI